jgi:outer membrane autotransporter protein
VKIYNCINRGYLVLSGLIVLGTAGLATGALAQIATSGLPLPPGVIVDGPIFRGNGTSVPSIATGADANGYLNVGPPTEPFTPSASTLVVRTSAPTQYVRAYTAGVTNPVGSFLGGSDTIRGLTAAQIRDVLALPYLPDSLTIVQVPAGTCLIVGEAAPILGNFAANPPNIPTAGPWGRGGVIQERLIGVTSNSGCAGAQFVPAADFVNRQPIGAAALSYRLRATTGNSLAAATALDRALPPRVFSDMDGIYNALDLINIGDAAPLRSALVQLDGEAYADVPTAEIEGARMFLGVLHHQMERSRATTDDPPVRQWLGGFGGGGGIDGAGDTHGIGYAMGGVAGGMEHRFAPTVLAGAAVGYTRSSYGTDGLSGNGGINTVSAALYASYAPSAWYVDGALGYGYSDGALDRAIVFPNVARGATGDLGAHEFLSSLELGYALPLGESTAVTPFVAMQGVVIFQNGLAESGAGAIDLRVRGRTTSSARGVLGAEITHALPVGLPTPLSLTLRAGWGHEFAAVSRSVTASFDGLPGAPFTIAGAPSPRDAAVIGIGASLAIQPSVDLFLRYDGVVTGRDSTHGAQLGLRVTF